jgi:hypothetical protein
MLHSLFRIPHVENINGNLGLQTVFNIQSVVHPDASLTYSVLKCEGDVQMKNVVLKLIDDKRTFRQMNGAMYLRNDEAGIENVSLKIGATDLAFNGVFKNIINYFKKDGNLTANVEVKSKFIDVQDLGTTSKEEKIHEARSFVLPSNIDGSLFMDVAQIEYDKHTFKIVGSTEANPDAGKISHESPIGKALMGKKVGEHAQVQIPAGSITYKILKVK